MKKLILFVSLFIYSCEKDELVVESELINFASCPSDVPTNKIIKFEVLDNPTVDYYVVEVTQGVFNTPEKLIKIETKNSNGVQRYECEIEMKSNMYTSRIQVVYNKKFSKFFDKTLLITR